MQDRIISITYPEKGKVRVREPFTKSSPFTKGRMNSNKMGRVIKWSSQGEKNFFQILEADSNVKSYGEQPVKIHYEYNGKVRTHVPDGLVVTKKGKWLCEVKPKDKVNQDLIDRTNLLTKLLPLFKDAYFYALVISEDIANPVKQKNLELILQLSKGFQASKYAQKIASCPEITTTLGSLCRQIGVAGYQEIFSLHVAGYLTIDISLPISDASLIHIH